MLLLWLLLVLVVLSLLLPVPLLLDVLLEAADCPPSPFFSSP